ncbi:MAG: hypothetical protein ACXWC9_05245 [Pseudobdellovibrionaceae bacterium]
MKRQYQDKYPLGRRIAPRYEINLEVIILTQTKSFRTRSLNVSASGALLKDSLPKEFMASQTLEIIFIMTDQNCKNRLLFKGRAVGGPNSSSRITFLESGVNSQSELQRAFKDLSPLPQPA